MKEEAFEIKCDNCQMEFPKVVLVKTGKQAKGPTTFEVECPNCGTLLTVDVGIPIAPNSSILKSLKKI